MLEVFTNFVCSLIMAVYGFYIIKKITKSDEKVWKIKTIILILLLGTIGALLRRDNYNGLSSIGTFTLQIIIYKMIFNVKIEESLLASAILTFLTFIGDLIMASIFPRFISINELRNIWYWFFITNSLVCFTGILLVKIKVISKPLQNFYENISRKKQISNILFLTLLVIGLCTLAQNITKTTNLNIDYFVNIIIMIIFFFITYLFIKSKNNYTLLTNEYDDLFNYVQNFEEWIEKEQLNRHEYKNQLAVLRCLTKEKKVKAKIDEILEDSINIEGEVVHQLKSLPKGGLQGLMYYKTAIAQKDKINLTVNVSLETKSILNRLSETDIRTLCKLIGIYFDNAIEAAKEARKKVILVEIYELTDKVNIVFSNTFKQHKNFGDRNKKGVSSKGEGHGNGLYFASKMIKKNEWLEEKQEVIDKYYIQELSIKNKNISTK